MLPPSPQAPVELNPFDLGTQLEGPGMLPCPALTWTGNQVLWAEIKHREENQARVEDGVVGLLGPEDHYLRGLSDSEFEVVVEDFTEKFDLSQTWVEGLCLQFLWAAEKVGSMRRY